MKKLLTALLIITFFNSCSDNKKATIKNFYFDLSTFMNNDIEKLHASHASVLKSASVNGDREENRFINIDWKREFDSFFSGDIHNNSFNEKYIVDTIVNSTDSLHTTMIRYVAKDEDLKTRVLEIHFDSNKNIELIKAELFSKNIISNLSESLIYSPLKYYSITNHEESRWFGSDDFIIEGRIENKSSETHTQ